MLRIRVAAVVVAAGIALADGALAATGSPPAQHRTPGSIVLTWNSSLLQAVRTVRFAPTVTARALAIVHTCMYDAWAAYDDAAAGTGFGTALRRPPHERVAENEAVAVSYAAYRALLDLFPSQAALFGAVMGSLGLDPLDASTDLSTPAGVGNAACAAVLEWRHFDGANQLGHLGGGPYGDYTGYLPTNTPGLLIDPNRWQPLATPAGEPQMFSTPQWGRVQPFALARPDQFRPRPPALYPHPIYGKQAEEVLALSAGLTAGRR